MCVLGGWYDEGCGCWLNARALWLLKAVMKEGCHLLVQVCRLTYDSVCVCVCLCVCGGGLGTFQSDPRLHTASVAGGVFERQRRLAAYALDMPMRSRYTLSVMAVIAIRATPANLHTHTHIHARSTAKPATVLWVNMPSSLSV